MSDVFPALESDEAWVLPINAVIVRAEDATVLVDTGLGPQPRTFIARDDWSFFISDESVGERPHLRDKVKSLGDSDLVDLVDGETDVSPGVRVVPTPGYTPGHTSVWIASQGSTLFLLGDVVVHEVRVADLDLVYVSDHDASLAAATRRTVLGRLADEGTDVIVSHFQGVGRFARPREGFSWAALAKEQAAPVE